jgi:hypothetical protein
VGIVAVSAPGEIVVYSRPMAPPHDKDEYNVMVAQRGQVARRWGWEIYGSGRPLPVPLRGNRFWSKRAAKGAGKAALRDFLEALVREQNN